MSGQHCENYDVKRETVHCYPRNVDRCFTWPEVAWWCRWNLSAFFNIFFCLVCLYNKSLDDWPLGEQWILFPSNLNVSLYFVFGNIENLGKQKFGSPRDQLLSFKYLFDYLQATTDYNLEEKWANNYHRRWLWDRWYLSRKTSWSY